MSTQYEVLEYLRYFRELGVEYIDAELEAFRTPDSSAPSSVRSGEIPPTISSFDLKPLASEIASVEKPKPGSRLKDIPSLASLSPQRTSKLEKNETAPSMQKEQVADKPQEPQTIRSTSETLDDIRADIGPDCSRCKLSTLGRRQVVNSTGNPNARLMFVGEAPGADEDEQGEPFVGRAGQLLTKIIESIGIERKDVFIGNINRCRPPKNRAPEPDETAACKPFLLREISVVRPKVIVVLGATAAQNLLETNVPIGKLRGRFHEYYGVKVMPTFHPAYLLRDPHKKREVWEDMKIVRDYLNSVANKDHWK